MAAESMVGTTGFVEPFGGRPNPQAKSAVAAGGKQLTVLPKSREKIQLDSGRDDWI